MHSRLNIPAPVGVKAANDATKELIIQSNRELRLRAEACQRMRCREKFAVVPPFARTVNRHRWVSVSALRRARETSLRNSAH